MCFELILTDFDLFSSYWVSNLIKCQDQAQTRASMECSMWQLSTSGAISANNSTYPFPETRFWPFLFRSSSTFSNSSIRGRIFPLSKHTPKWCVWPLWVCFCIALPMILRRDCALRIMPTLFAVAGRCLVRFLWYLWLLFCSKTPFVLLCFLCTFCFQIGRFWITELKGCVIGFKGAWTGETCYQFND